MKEQYIYIYYRVRTVIKWTTRGGDLVCLYFKPSCHVSLNSGAAAQSRMDHFMFSKDANWNGGAAAHNRRYDKERRVARELPHVPSN